MRPRARSLVTFGALAAAPTALGFVVVESGVADALVVIGSVALFAGLLVLQVRVGIAAMRVERGPAAPVARLTALVCAGAIPVFFAVLLSGRAFGAFDAIDRGLPFDWGQQFAFFLSESLVVEALVTAAVVSTVVAVVQRLQRRRHDGTEPARAG